MKWILFDFKTAKEAWFEEVEQVYIKKINHFVKFEVSHLRTNKADREQAEIKKTFEEKILLEKITSDDFVILFDERGLKYNSIQFSKKIQQAQESSKKRGVLIIGGAYGVSESIIKRSNLLVNLSDMTMNHLIAETVVFEQFYRAFTILNRIPYHNV